MSKIGLIALALVFSACTSSAASISPAPTASDVPAPSGACIDRERLSDTGEPVIFEIQGMAAALKSGDVDKARSFATTAIAGMRSIADLADPVRPDAAKGLRAVADKLDKAKAAFPDGQSTIDQVEQEWASGLQLARTGVCPD